MAAIERTTVSLRIFGEDLDPDEITALLGIAPTEAYRKDDPRSPRRRAARPRGSWHLRSGDAEPGDLDRQIRELLAKTTDDPAVWQDIHARYQADLFAGLFMGFVNEGLTLTPETQMAAANRGLAIGFDIYGPPSDDDED